MFLFCLKRSIITEVAKANWPNWSGKDERKDLSGKINGKFYFCRTKAKLMVFFTKVVLAKSL